jgi:hypothetical protein
VTSGRSASAHAAMRPYTARWDDVSGCRWGTRAALPAVRTSRPCPVLHALVAVQEPPGGFGAVRSPPLWSPGKDASRLCEGVLSPSRRPSQLLHAALTCISTTLAERRPPTVGDHPRRKRPRSADLGRTRVLRAAAACVGRV